jgi:hypothetical protein
MCFQPVSALQLNVRTKIILNVNAWLVVQARKISVKLEKERWSLHIIGRPMPRPIPPGIPPACGMS